MTILKAVFSASESRSGWSDLWELEEPASAPDLSSPLGYVVLGQTFLSYLFLWKEWGISRQEGRKLMLPKRKILNRETVAKAGLEVPETRQDMEV